MQELK